MIYKKCTTEKKFTENNQIIQNQIRKLSKLIVVEGSYSDIYEYKDEKSYLGSLLRFEKKILVVTQAKVQISYDLKKIDFKLDSINKMVYIKDIPKPEVQIVPQINYYDLAQSTFNEFSAQDFNIVKDKAIKRIETQAKSDHLEEKANIQLIEELNDIILLSKVSGWKIINETKFKLATNDL